MTNIHFVMQGKGGVGKSLIASYIAQYLRDRDVITECFDTDPVNHTFSQWKALNVEKIEIMGSDGDIDPSGFDFLLLRLALAKGDCVVDAGTATMLPLINYLSANKSLDFLNERGSSVFIHIPITANDAFDTFDGFVTLVDESPEFVRIVIWVNEFFGGSFEAGGVPLEDLDAYIERVDRVQALVRLEKNPPMFAQDLNKLIVARQTFLEAANDPTHFLMNKRRTYMIWLAITNQLKTAFAAAW